MSWCSLGWKFSEALYHTIAVCGALNSWKIVSGLFLLNGLISCSICRYKMNANVTGLLP